MLLCVPPLQFIAERVISGGAIHPKWYYNGRDETFPGTIFIRSDGIPFISLKHFLEVAAIPFTEQGSRLVFVHQEHRVEVDRVTNAVYVNDKKTKWNARNPWYGPQYVPLEMMKKIGFVVKFEPKRQWIVVAKDAIPVLMYHHFATNPLSYELGGTIDPTMFAEHLDALLQGGYTPISMQTLKAFYYDHTPLPRKPIVITIDDGYESNYSLAYPLLKQRNIPASIFAVTTFRGQKPGVLAHFTWPQAKEMQDSGLITIENHTHNLHYRIGRQSALSRQLFAETDEQHRTRIVRDVTQANVLIAQHTGYTPVAFSYPYGKYDRSIITALAGQAKLYFTTRQGINYAHTPVTLLRRINAYGGLSGPQLLQKIEDSYFRF